MSRYPAEDRRLGVSDCWSKLVGVKLVEMGVNSGFGRRWLQGIGWGYLRFEWGSPFAESYHQYIQFAVRRLGNTVNLLEVFLLDWYLSYSECYWSGLAGLLRWVPLHQTVFSWTAVWVVNRSYSLLMSVEGGSGSDLQRAELVVVVILVFKKNVF